AIRVRELLREEGLRRWAALKLYRSTRFDTAATTTTLEGGELDRAAGLSYHQIAMAGRSLHRSQDMGRIQQLGPSSVRLALVRDRTGHGGDGFFAGIDTLLRAPGPVPRAADADAGTLLALLRRRAAAHVPTE